MLNFNEFNLKSIKSSKSSPLTSSEKSNWGQFYMWIQNHINKEIVILYRGTTKDKLRERLKEEHQTSSSDYWMNTLFNWGEKAKSYLSKKEIDKEILKSIDDISSETFTFIFKKIGTILMGENEIVSNFISQNPDFDTYFKKTKNLSSFLKIILNQNISEQLKIRNYYLRIIHTIFELGNKNEASIFVSTSKNLHTASNFSNEENGIVIIYWLAKPIVRFGLSIDIIHDITELAINLKLPYYFSEFYPKDNEFCILGALFPGQIIGYIDKKDFIINSNLLESGLEFNDEKLNIGFQNIGIDNQLDQLKNMSTYKRQVTLWENSIFEDR